MMLKVALLVAMVVGSMATYPGYYGHNSWSMLPYRRPYGGGLLYGGYGGGYDPYYSMGYNSYYGDYDPYYYGGGSIYNSYRRPGHFGKRGRY